MPRPGSARRRRRCSGSPAPWAWAGCPRAGWRWGWGSTPAGAGGWAGLPGVGLALGLALTTGMAWGLGAVTLRLSGPYLPLCTIAWGLSLYYLFGNMSFLGGQTGITGVPPLVLGGWSLAAPRAIGLL